MQHDIRPFSLLDTAPVNRRSQFHQQLYQHERGALRSLSSRVRQQYCTISLLGFGYGIHTGCDFLDHTFVRQWQVLSINARHAFNIGGIWHHLALLSCQIFGQVKPDARGCKVPRLVQRVMGFKSLLVGANHLFNGSVY